MTSRYRPRRQFKFLLYQDVDMELILTDFILRLKGERKFATVVKNGLRLMGSLMEKNLSVLLELFPWIEAAILTSAPKPPSAPDSGNLERLIQGAVQSSVQQALMNMPSLPATTPVAAPLKQSGTLGAGKVMALPTFDDDDDDTIVIKESAHKPTTFQNLLAGMMQADERSERLYAERLAAGDIDPRTGRSLSARLD